MKIIDIFCSAWLLKNVIYSEAELVGSAVVQKSEGGYDP